MSILKEIQEKAKSNLKKIVFPEGEDERVLKAAEICQKEKLVVPFLLGNPENIIELATRINVDLANIEIIDAETDSEKDDYAMTFRELRKHKGMDLQTAVQTMKQPLPFGAMMVRKGREIGRAHV